MNKLNIRLTLLTALVSLGLFTVGCASKEAQVCKHMEELAESVGEEMGEDEGEDCEESLAEMEEECGDKYTEALDCMLELEVPEGAEEDEAAMAVGLGMMACAMTCVDEGGDEEAEEEEAE